MGVNTCTSVRQVRGVHCTSCSRVQIPPPTLVLPPLALEQDTTPTKDKKGSKMKVLKKIKKKMGLAPRTTCSSGTPNNLPPLTFHRVHGENVRISVDGFTARRVESFCKGVAFSARPVRINEKVYIRFVEISNNWSGVLRFGFTSYDPASLDYCLPKYACPDLTNKEGYWAKALGERFCDKDNVLYYYVNSAGDVNFGVNGEDKGVFFTGVDTRSPVWTLVDIYGNCTAIQFADPRVPLPRRLLPTVDPEERLASSLRNMNIDDGPPPTVYQNQPVFPVNLHRTKGINVQASHERGIASRVDDEFSQGYVFTSLPLRPSQTLIVQILRTANAYTGSLAIGLTSCDPAKLKPTDLPDDVEQLLDRPEYWVVRRDAANGSRKGDEIAVNLTVDGEVKVSRNGATPVTVMYVDHSLLLWAFVDIYGTTQRVRLLNTMPLQRPAPQNLRVQLESAQLNSGAGGTVLVVSLPPQNGNQGPPNHQRYPIASAHYIEPIQSSSQPSTSSQPWPDNASCSSSQNNSNQQLDSERVPIHHGLQTNHLNQMNLPSTSHQPHYNVLGEIPPGWTGTECSICYENQIDSVLYCCGHMCMCYRCAVQLWKGKFGGQCPMCRAPIKDVIKTYKS